MTHHEVDYIFCLTRFVGGLKAARAALEEAYGSTPDDIVDPAELGTILARLEDMQSTCYNEMVVRKRGLETKVVGR